MGAYKQFLASDIIITPFEVNKGFIFNASEFTNSNVSIDRFLGKNITSPIFNPLSDPTTGYISTQYQRLVYSSIQELYYSNYLSSSYSDKVNRPILVPGVDTAGDRLVGLVGNQSYNNYSQNTLTYPKFFPTASNASIGIISIPVGLFGDYIQPNSFTFVTPLGQLTDDGEGNVISNGNIVGNIFYPHGLITVTSASDSTINDFVTSTFATCSFLSSFKIQETQYKCTIRQNEFSFTLNPSVISSSAEGTLYGFVTESYFSPYINTVGLYDEAQNLLAIGKLAQPLPSSPTTDTTILINLDR